LLSKLVLRPVKIVHTREEDMYASAVRHESVIHLKVGVSREGTLLAAHAQVFMNAGPYTTHSAVVMAATSRKFQYRVPHYLFEGHCVLTNAPVAGAMRGFGNPQMTFARELLLDRIARKLNLDPVRMRLENHLQAGDTFPGGSPLVWSCAIEDCAQGAEKIKKEIDEKEGKQNREGLKEAWGVSFGCHTSGPSSKEGMSSCIISTNDDGTVQLMTGSADIGQGSETTLCQVAAEELGLELSDITIHAADTLTTPYDTGTFASSQMYISGNAVQKAATHLLQNLKVALQKIYLIAVEKIECRNGKITLDLGRETKTLTFKQAIKEIIFNDHGSVLLGHASFKAEESPPPFAVCWAKVVWDRRTNNVEVKHVIEAVDVGTAINPEVVIGQVQGGIAMGFGYAMLEQVELDPHAKKPISSDLLHYKVPLSPDAPQAHVYIAKSYEPTGPFGAKSVGEAATVPVAAAIANAIARATGEEIKALPLSQLFVPAKLRMT
jgi:CO/xanthine dehydrogenase Mo-binding subunit